MWSTQSAALISQFEPGLEVERFYANGTEGVHEGVNHLDGERALAFARERHAYLDGDNQRIRNQQQVMKALMRSVMSPSMLGELSESADRAFYRVYDEHAVHARSAI